jgi:putative mRNA 3-end processing factor
MKIRVLGAAREVGGSCIAVETPNAKIALDYGIKLEGITDEYPKNFDAIFISHAHLDHSGSLPRLSKSRNPQKIVGAKITRDVTVDLLKDMIKIQSTKRDGETYELSVADKVKDCWTVADSYKLPDMTVTLQDAGHVVGAKITTVRSEGKAIVYTGDFCVHDTEILEGCNLNVLPKEPDLLITESTYGGRIRPPRAQLTAQFLKQLQASNLCLPPQPRNGQTLRPSHPRRHPPQIQRLRHLKTCPQNHRPL